MNEYHAIKQFDTQCVLGESPLWHKSSSTLFWLDIKRQLLFSYQQGQKGQQVEQISLGATVSFIAETTDPQLLIGLADFGIVLIDLISHKLNCVQYFPSNEVESNRANDGGISPQGHLVFGTMDNEARSDTGSLYYFDGELACLTNNILVPNLFAFTDNENFFFADSLNNSIQRCQLDKRKLTKKNWISTPQGVFPDGGCLDQQGGLWSAQWGASQVVRYSLHDKTITDIIHLPELQVASCCFVGEEMDTLFITTASEGISSVQLGSCYLCELPYQGQSTYQFNTSILRKLT